MNWFVFDADAWLKKIPRPDRSGYIAVFMMLNIIHGVLNMGGGDPQLCDFVPFMPCPVYAETPREKIKKAKVTPLQFLGQGSGKEKDDTCHLDIHTSPEQPHRVSMLHVSWIRVRRQDIATAVNPDFLPSGEYWEDKTETQPQVWSENYGHTTFIKTSQYTFVNYRTSQGTGTEDVIDIPYGLKVEMRWHCKQSLSDRARSSAVDGHQISNGRSQ